MLTTPSIWKIIYPWFLWHHILLVLLFTLWQLVLHPFCKPIFLHSFIKCWCLIKLCPRPLLFSLCTAPVDNLINSYGFDNYLHADGCQLYSSCLHFFPELQIYISKCLLNISPWIFHGHLKLNKCKVEFSVSPLKPVFLGDFLSQ